jgi:uncharacterized membrane protein (DUF106 family)
MIAIFNSVLGRIFDVVLLPFQALHPWVAIAILSLVTSVCMLYVYRLVADQAGIRLVKNRISAHLLEMRLYQHNMPVTFKAQGKILAYNLRYLLLSTRPMLVMAVPLALAILQLDLRFGVGPLNPGEPTILKIRLKEGHQPSRVVAALESCPGLVIETPPLRIDRDRELDWRVRATTAATGDLTIRVGDETVTKRVVAGTADNRGISPARVGGNWFDEILSPGEPPLADASALESVEIGYPARRMNMFGLRLHWLVVYFTLSVLSGLALKGIFRVEM